MALSGALVLDKAPLMKIWAWPGNEENEMKRFLKLLTGPLAFASVFLLFGTPSAPGTSLVPTTGGAAHAYFGITCVRAHPYQGHDVPMACLGRGMDRYHTRCNVYGRMAGIDRGASRFGFLGGIRASASWLGGC